MFENQLLMMNEFAGGMADWGLQAVVNKGFTNDCSTSTMNNPVQSCFVPFGIQQNDADDDLLFSSHNLFETSTVLDELEELYKPFYPVLHPLSPQAAIVTASISVPRDVKDQSQKKRPHPGPAAAKPANTSRAPQSKRSRNQRKKTVLQVTADGLSSDLWAWRKYGQKPIKGSPYPRSYYRCSSSKGCLARKQVEQSSSEPGMFIITYTAEHSHAHPTRRSSLAGSSRNKSSAPKRPSSSKPNTPTVKKDSCCSPTTVLSPTTPLTACIEDESPQQAATKSENREEEQENAITDLFTSFDELDRLTSNMAFDHWFSDQILPSFSC